MTQVRVWRTRGRFVARRRNLGALAALPWLAIGLPTKAAAGMKRLGILAHGRREETLAFHDSAMRKLFSEYGWVEGKTFEIIWRFLDGDETRAPALARELVDARPDVIATGSTARTRALQLATRTIPILTDVGDPVGSGFARSLRRPGGNITGLSQGAPEVAAKQVELLRAVLPKLSTLVVVGGSKSRPIEEIAEPAITAARAAGIASQARRISSLADVEAAFRAVPAAGRGAAFVLGNLAGLDAGEVLKIANRVRVPTMVGHERVVELGGLLSYTLLHEDADRRSVAILDKLLRGADPASIPFELPGKTQFAINRRTAAAIGINFPADFALRATRIIG